MKLAALSLSIILSAGAAAQSPLPPEAQTIRVDATPRLVTVYTGRAAVTRSVRRLLGPGIYAFAFSGLPESVQPESLQAHVSGPARVLGVEYLERAALEAGSSRLAELDTALTRNADELTRHLEDRELIEARRSDLDTMSKHAAQTGGANGGTDGIDLDAIGDQLSFFAAGRKELLEERREVDRFVQELQQTRRILESERASLAESTLTARDATVTVVVDGGTEITVDLVYLVTNATWTPAYNIRAAAQSPRVDIEYDALIEQRSGEDWTNVELVISTAQPTRAADPPALTPWIVDVRDPEVSAAIDDGKTAAILNFPSLRTGDDAALRGSDPTVTYAISRPVSVPTDSRRKQRARITNLVSAPTYTHVAIPLLTESVYVRSDLRNDSDFQLLPGPAAIFVGADYVGPTVLDAIAPHERFQVYFGIDRTVTVTRTLLSRHVAKTGLLGGGLKTSYDYRIEIVNGAGKDLRLDLWDRMPTSRSNRVQVQLVGLTHDLSADARYFEDDFSRGLLKWDLTIPAGTQDANTTIVEFGVRVVRAKEVDVSGLPE